MTIQISVILLVILVGILVRNRKFFNFICLINGYKLTKEEKENIPKQLIPFIRIVSYLFLLLGFLLLIEVFAVHHFNIFQYAFNHLITFATWVIIVIIVCYKNKYEMKQYVNYWLKRK